MVKTKNFEKIEVQSATQLRDWLFINHTQKESIWLVTYKKHVPDKYVSISEVLDQLLCFGWIDGIRRKLDEDKTMQLISPKQTQPNAEVVSPDFIMDIVFTYKEALPFFMFMDIVMEEKDLMDFCK